MPLHFTRRRCSSTSTSYLLLPSFCGWVGALGCSGDVPTDSYSHLGVDVTDGSAATTVIPSSATSGQASSGAAVGSQGDVGSNSTSATTNAGVTNTAAAGGTVGTTLASTPAATTYAATGAGGASSLAAGSGSTVSVTAADSNSVASTTGAGNESGTFAQVAPYLTGYCGTSTACHGPGAREVEFAGSADALYGLVMSLDVQLCGGQPFVSPGDPAGSALYNLLVGDCGNERMPPACRSDACTGVANVEMVRSWIESGALDN